MTQDTLTFDAHWLKIFSLLFSKEDPLILYPLRKAEILVNFVPIHQCINARRKDGRKIKFILEDRVENPCPKDNITLENNLFLLGIKDAKQGNFSMNNNGTITIFDCYSSILFFSEYLSQEILESKNFAK